MRLSLALNAVMFGLLMQQYHDCTLFTTSLWVGITPALKWGYVMFSIPGIILIIMMVLGIKHDQRRGSMDSKTS